MDLALEDEGLAAVLAALHEAPQRRWTVASMAEVAHLSRAGFARRFAQTVGQTPAAYVIDLRVERAAEQLQTTRATVATVANDNGFASEFSLNTAFKRRYGVSPGRWRRRAARLSPPSTEQVNSGPHARRRRDLGAEFRGEVGR